MTISKPNAVVDDIATIDLRALPPDFLLTEAQVAVATNIPATRFHLFRHKGGGPKYIKAGARTVRYKARSVLEWLEAHAEYESTDQDADSRKRSRQLAAAAHKGVEQRDRIKTGSLEQEQRGQARDAGDALKDGRK